jgi:[ribosomal protein S5]-alanine N-acetyltransferase
LAARIEFVRGSRLYLRPLQREDLNPRYLSWLNDPEVTRYMETGTFPTTARDLEKFYDEVTGTRNQVILAVADKKSGQHIGNVKLGPIQWIHRCATLGIMIGDKKFWGKGAGLEATRLMVEYGFERLNLRRIDLEVFADHDAAVRCYEKAGFKVEGRRRENFFRNGKYVDRLLMALLRSEYKPLGATRRR